jgi:hypothetical protein
LISDFTMAGQSVSRITGCDVYMKRCRSIVNFVILMFDKLSLFGIVHRLSSYARQAHGPFLEEPGLRRS